MPISEIPAKMIEKTESYNEARMSAAVELTKVTYPTSVKVVLNEEEIFNTFMNYYNKIKKIPVPPMLNAPLGKINWRKKSIIVFGSLILVIISMLLFYFKGRLISFLFGNI
jgi:hypothetical protein